MVWCKVVGEVGVEGCGRLIVNDGFWDFPLIEFFGSIVEVFGASAYALGDRRVCVEVVRFVSPACMT
jgi:hypothetical protein